MYSYEFPHYCLTTDVACIYKGEILVGTKNGKYCLIGGHLNEGERLKDCAIREFGEETCIHIQDKDNVVLINIFDKPERDERERKISVLFLYRPEVKPECKAEDDIDSLEWLKLSNVLCMKPEQFCWDHHAMIFEAMVVSSTIALGDLSVKS